MIDQFLVLQQRAVDLGEKHERTAEVTEVIMIYFVQLAGMIDGLLQAMSETEGGRSLIALRGKFGDLRRIAKSKIRDGFVDKLTGQ